MAKDGKFGTFAGVYIPSLLTILGVIMYLRLPWIVGNAGLYTTLAIIAAAHVVSICTGLSVSSIATDKKVGAGGPYYIISRSLGLPIGGSIGVALFVGMGFAIALHTVGFSESVLPALGIEPTPNAIRVAGTITLVAITAVAFISTSLAITIQYPILVMVAASIVVVFLGRTDTPSSPQLSAHADAPSFAVMFGVFFPAATGFMAGVNMSGDLRDPKTSIIRGTILAILTALVLYVALVLFLAYRIEPARLRDDEHVLEHMALWGPVVMIGIWGATLSSAFGAVLGAPRILQKMSSDRITPHMFAKGHGPANEPRRATMLTFMFAEAGILIAELNVIARIVSMIYLTHYAVINISCTLESWASPDFRPKFRIPKTVSIIGAVSCMLLMIQLDLIAALGATALMIGLFVYYQRRQLTLESGDAWQGVWSTIVRAGLHRLDARAGQQRNWRPNVMLFDESGHAKHAAIRTFAATLASANGMVTDVALVVPGAEAEDEEEREGAPTDAIGLFDRKLVTDRPFETIAAFCEFHGFSGIAPNTVLLPWRQRVADPEGFLRVLGTAARRELNVLLFEEPRGDTRSLKRQIDIWWAREAGNLAFSLALARFITRSEDWERASITVCIVGEGTDDDEVLRAKASRYLELNRIEARVRVVYRPHGEGLHDLVCNESRNADLVMLGLTRDDQTDLEQLEKVAALPGGVVFLRGGSAFTDVLVAAPRAHRSVRVPGAPTPPAGVPVLAMPAQPELAAAVTAFLAHETQLLSRIQERIAAGYGVYLDLCATARSLVEQRADSMIAAAREPNPVVRRKQLSEATTRFIGEAERALAQITADSVAAQATLLGEALADVVKLGAAMPADLPPVVRVERPRSLFAASTDDSRALRAWKRRRRWRYFYRRAIPQRISVTPLVQQRHDRILGEDVTRIVARFRTATHDLAVEISRALATAEWKAHAELSRSSGVDLEASSRWLEQSRDDVLRRLDGIATHTRERIAEHAQALDASALEAARLLSATLDRVDAPLAARATAAHHKRGELDRLCAVPNAWRDEQLQLLERSRLAVGLARFRDRLTIAASRALEEIVSAAHASAQRVLGDLEKALAERAASGATFELPDEVPYDASPIVSRFARLAATLSGDLPESATLLTDDAVAALVRGDEGTEATTVSVRAAVQNIVEADLITRLSAEVAHVAEADARGWAAARETLMLVNARPRENDDDSGEPAHPFDEVIARLQTQLAKLRESEIACVQGVLDGLQAVATATGFGGLTSSLVDRGARRAAAHGPSRVRELARSAAASVRELAAGLIYRRSAGVVYARDARAARARTAEQLLREVAARATITPAVLTTMPLYYRNLFTGQVNITESFFIGRADRVKRGAAVVAGDRGSGLRTALVVGERGAGKTTLCQQIAAAAHREVHWIAAPQGGASSRQALQAAFESALARRGTPLQLLQRLPDASLIVFDDLDLWWERRAGGLEAIDALLELVAQTGDRIAFVLAGGEPAVRVLQQLRPLSRHVYERLDCQPLAARMLGDVIMTRHRSTGLGLELKGRDSLGPLARARLFDAHFAFARGNVGCALRSWVTHIDRFADDRIAIRTPVPLDWDVLDDLRAEHVALLVELALHKAATADKLERVTQRPAGAIADGLAELTSIGLVSQSRRKIAQINPFVHVPLIHWLERRELA